MRLKGGKVLLDLTDYGDINNNDISHPLSEEEIKAILEKGLAIRIIKDTAIVVYEPPVSEINNTQIIYSSIGTGASERNVVLNFTTKVFEIVEP